MGKEAKIRQPLTKGAAKVPVVMQMEALECGAASLTMILAYYGKWIPLEQVRADCGVSRDGASAKNVLRAARSYGMIAKGYRYEPEALRTDGKFPCIIHWNFNHFVVLCGFKGNKAILNDPARGNCAVPMETFDKSFTGVCLMIEPGEDFEPGGKPKSMIGFALQRLRGAGEAVAFTVITAVIASLISIIQPAFSRIFLDRLLTGENPEWVTPFLWALAGLSILQIVIDFIQAIYSTRINGKIAAVGSTTYMWKILRLPMEFFSQRMAGDIQQRKGENASIAASLVSTFAPLVIEAAMMYLDWLCQPDVIFALQNGVEGITYDLNEDGVPVVKNPDEANHDKTFNSMQNLDYTLLINGQYLADESLLIKAQALSYQGYADEYEALYKAFHKDPLNTGWTFEVVLQASSEYGTRLGEFENEMLTKVTMADPAEASALFDQMLKEFKAMGGQACYDEATAAWDAAHPAQ